jgi:hypothetical protein
MKDAWKKILKVLHTCRDHEDLNVTRNMFENFFFIYRPQMGIKSFFYRSSWEIMFLDKKKRLPKVADKKWKLRNQL